MTIVFFTDASTAAKPDRSSSPNAMNEDDRRDLIARQHRALYGNEPAHYSPDGVSRQSQGSRLSISGSARGSSPLAFDPFGAQAQTGGAPAESAVQMPPREPAASAVASDRRVSTSPSVSNPPGFSMAEAVHQPTRTTDSPSNSSPSLLQGSILPQPGGGVAPIGTRPSQANAATKRSTTPGERAAPAQSGATPTDNAAGLGSWGANSGGVWGSKNTLGVQASVWG